MSQTKVIAVILGLLFATAVGAQSLSEQAEAVRAKEAQEAKERMAKEIPKIDPAKPVAKPVVVRRLSYQVHSVIMRNGTWFAEVARQNLLSLATVGAQIEQGQVTSINGQGVALVYPPDPKCLAKKKRLKGKRADALVCNPVQRFVPVGDYF